MKITKDTLEILSNFSKINPHIVFEKGNVIRTVSVDSLTYAQAKVKEEFPLTFGVFDLKALLTIFSLFDGNEVTFEEKYMIISDTTGKSKIKFVYAKLDSFIHAEIGKNAEMDEKDVTFKITENNFKNLIKISSVLQNKDVVISGTEDKIFVHSLNAQEKENSSYMYEIGENTGKPFMVPFKLENLLMMPDSYEISLAIDGRIGYFKSLTKNLEYFVCGSIEDIEQ